MSIYFGLCWFLTVCSLECSRVLCFLEHSVLWKTPVMPVWEHWFHQWVSRYCWIYCTWIGCVVPYGMAGFHIFSIYPISLSALLSTSYPQLNFESILFLRLMLHISWSSWSSKSVSVSGPSCSVPKWRQTLIVDVIDPHVSISSIFASTYYYAQKCMSCLASIPHPSAILF